MTQMTIMTGEDRRRKWPLAERERILAAAFTPGDLSPESAPLVTRVLALHRLGLTPADEANSAGVRYPRDV